MRTQRSGEMTPRRAACARSKREVCVGKRSVTWRAISAPVAVMPMKIGPVQCADRAGGLLAQRGVRLVADDDRVRVGDVAGVAHEPLVGLDRHRAVGAVLALSSAGAIRLRVAAVAQLAVELVDQVAAVGEDQDAAGARRLDEAERGDRLAGAGRVLEPEALAGVRVLGRLGDVCVVVAAPARPSPAAPRARPRRRRPPRPGCRRARAGAPRSATAPLPSPLPLRWRVGEQRGQRARQRVDLVGGEDRAVDERRLVLATAAARARAAATSGAARRPTAPSRPASISASAASSARRRGVPGASAVAASSPSGRKGSRVNADARSISSVEGRAWPSSATGVVSAMKRLESVRRRRRLYARDGSSEAGGARELQAPVLAFPSDRAPRESAPIEADSQADRADLPPSAACAACSVRSRRDRPGRRSGHRADPGRRRDGDDAGDRAEVRPAGRAGEARRRARAARRRCTRRPNELLGGGTSAFDAAARRSSRATPSWSTSGRRGAGRAAPSSRSSSRSPPSAARRSRFLGVNGSRQGLPAAREVPRQAPAAVPVLRRTRTRSIAAEAEGRRRSSR